MCKKIICSYEVFEKLINERGVTTYKVSKDTKIPQCTFSNWKYGICTPKTDKLYAIANYFDLPIEHFLKEEVN